VASIKAKARTPRKKYVPSAEQRADDDRLRKQFQNLTDAEMDQFVGKLGKAVKSLERQTTALLDKGTRHRPA
jgi:hypothetical protein